MLTPDTIAELDAFRGVPPGTPVCPAPAINLHFSQLGVVTACCFNRTQVLGVYPENSVDQIWHGEPIRKLREALSGYDLTRGCGKCAQQIEAKDFGGAHAVFYTQQARVLAGVREQWGMHAEGDPGRAPLPMRLEFNIHNACNLQCVMCHGLASSSIRTHREALPSLANPYDAAFVEQLAPFLASVVETDFMGGEPFMIPTYRMLWERIALENPRLKVCILTNGTVLDDSIKDLLERINCWIHISIDSHDKRTYESIRRGASFERVMENCAWYQQLMKSRGLACMWRFCPMRLNWREIPDVVRHCNANDVLLMFNQVDSPLSLSLHTLAPAELASVVAYLKAQAPTEFESEAERNNLNTYVELIRRLEGFLDPSNRLNGLRARIDTSQAVIGQYTRSEKRRVAPGVSVPVDSGPDGVLTEAAKRYVTTRLNVEQARRTENHLPQEFASALSQARASLLDLLDGTDPQRFVGIFLSELIRTYSSVWGVRKVHEATIFETVGHFSAAVAQRPDSGRIIHELLASPPRELYELLGSGSAREALGFFEDA